MLNIYILNHNKFYVVKSVTPGLLDKCVAWVLLAAITFLISRVSQISMWYDTFAVTIRMLLNVY